MARMTVILPDGRSRDYELQPHNTIGRHPHQTIQVLDRLVSKEHMIVRKDAEKGWLLEDLGSLNGTTINGNRIQGTIPLVDQMAIQVGTTTMTFSDEAGAAAGKHKITIGDSLETSICNAVTQYTADEFLPVDMINDTEILRRDYEKLRIAARLQHEISGELRLEKLLPLLLEELFGLFKADRGLILLAEGPNARMAPRAVKVRGKKTAEPITLSRTILQKVLAERTAVLTSDAQHDERFAHAKSVIIQGIRSSMCVPLLARDQAVMGIVHLDSQMAINAFTERDLAMLQGIAQQASIAVEISRLVEQIEHEARTRQKFEKMLSPNLVDRVVSGDLEIKKGGEMRASAVMFSDIRGFTSLSERSDPQELVKLLNEYFELLVDVIFEFDGTLDKFMGDGVMAIWGSPMAIDRADEKAVLAGVKIQKVMAQFNNLRRMDGLAPIETGIGIDTGDLLAGYMGSSKTMSYTVLGPCVNTASRLCSKAAPGEVLITTRAYESCKHRVMAEPREPLILKGISAPVPAFNVYDARVEGTESGTAAV
jgi:adenylate cyclase